MHPLLITALRSLRVPVALAALVTALATVFAWPASDLGPRDLPIVISGSTQFVTATTDALNARVPGGFDITVAPSDGAGRAMLRDNEVYGLYEESAQGPRLVLASAGRPAVADLLTSVEFQMSRHVRSGVVTDEVPPPGGDPHSAALVAAALPTVLGSIAAGAILALGKRTPTSRLLSGAAVAGLSGLAITAVLNNWLAALGGDWWALAGCFALGVGAIVAAINGVAHVFGHGGLIATGATVMLLGNPLSGATSAPEMLPDGWSALGRILPPGALDSAVQAVAYYDNSGASSSLLILAAWAVVGSLLLLAGPATALGRRQHTATTGPARLNNEASG